MEDFSSGQVDGAVGLDAYGAGELGGVVDGDGDEVVGADRLLREIGAAGVVHGGRPELREQRGDEEQGDEELHFRSAIPSSSCDIRSIVDSSVVSF